MAADRLVQTVTQKIGRREIMEDIFWNLAQQKQIGNAKSEAADAKRTAKSAEEKIADLEQSFDRLLLINRALWEILQQFHRVDDAFLAKKVQEIDLRDGRADGKFSRQRLLHCRRCGKVLNKRHTRCIYCGAPDLQTSSFDKVK